jgi:hypothetical protein
LTQSGSASAVVQDYATYRAQQDAFLMLKLMVQGEADVQKNRVSPQAKVFDGLRASLLKPIGAVMLVHKSRGNLRLIIEQ